MVEFLTGKTFPAKNLESNFKQYSKRNSNILLFNNDLFSIKEVYSRIIESTKYIASEKCLNSATISTINDYLRELWLNPSK